MEFCTTFILLYFYHMVTYKVGSSPTQKWGTFFSNMLFCRSQFTCRHRRRDLKQTLVGFRGKFYTIPGAKQPEALKFVHICRQRNIQPLSLNDLIRMCKATYTKIITAWPFVCLLTVCVKQLEQQCCSHITLLM